MSENNITSVMDTAMEKLRGMVDAETVIGKPIVVGNLTLIPVSKVSFGLVTGGSDLPTKGTQPLFGGGGGAGATVTPVAFAVVCGTSVKMLPIRSDAGTVDRLIESTPDLIEKVKSLFAKD